MNSISRRILSAIAFFAILLALLIALSALLRPKGFRREDGVQDPIANAVYLEPEQTIDVLFLGDSETYCSFIPLQIYKEHGITSFVCGTSLQMLSYTEEFLHGVFEKQSPKIVFLETNTVFRKEDIFSEIARSAERIFPVFRYHNRWKTVFSTKESRRAISTIHRSIPPKPTAIWLRAMKKNRCRCAIFTMCGQCVIFVRSTVPALF